MNRISRDELFMEMAALVSRRSTCLRGNVGAVIVVDKHVVSIGYNGAPPGQPHCLDVGCETLGGSEGCTRTTHAETNAVAFAARRGIPCVNGTMYCTHCMCATCAAIVVAAGIWRVVYRNSYRLTEGLELLQSCGLLVEQLYV